MTKNNTAQKVKKIINAVNSFKTKNKDIRKKMKSILDQRQKRLTTEKIEKVKNKIKEL
ncbi:hypothetical protein KJ785_02580 [Patescibacteria group bacterium]|nr:hypothetical protein [Patescibacteria group bacterium]